MLRLLVFLQLWKFSRHAVGLCNPPPAVYVSLAVILGLYHNTRLCTSAHWGKSWLRACIQIWYETLCISLLDFKYASNTGSNCANIINICMVIVYCITYVYCMYTPHALLLRIMQNTYNVCFVKGVPRNITIQDIKITKYPSPGISKIWSALNITPDMKNLVQISTILVLIHKIEIWTINTVQKRQTTFWKSQDYEYFVV